MNDIIVDKTTGEIIVPLNVTKALKTALVAETAEKYYRKARDREGLFNAIEEKLTAQKTFVDWWDSEAAKDKGGRPTETGDRSVTGLAKLADFKLDKKTVSRWRLKLSDFEKAVNEAKAKALKYVEFASADAERMVSSETNEWYTPVHIINAAREVMGGIDLDPASNDQANEWIKADHYYTKEDDALTKPWAGRLWINPPYGGKGPAFTRKLLEEISAGRVTQAILLVNGTAGKDNWFQPLFDFPLCWMQPLRFINEDGDEQAKAMFASVAVYFGPNEKGFICEFSNLGPVLKRCK